MADLIDLIDTIGPLVPGAPNAALINAYRKAVREWCHETRTWVKTLEGVPITTPVTDLTIDADTQVFDANSVRIGRDELVKMTPTAPDVPRATDSGPPRAFWFEAPNRMRVAPDPDPNAGIVADIDTVLRPSLIASTIDDALVEEFGEYFEYGALAHLYRMPGQPWTEFSTAALYDSMFEEELDEMRDRGSRRFARNVPLRMKYGGY